MKKRGELHNQIPFSFVSFSVWILIIGVNSHYLVKTWVTFQRGNTAADTLFQIQHNTN